MAVLDSWVRGSAGLSFGGSTEIIGLLPTDPTDSHREVSWPAFLSPVSCSRLYPVSCSCLSLVLRGLCLTYTAGSGIVFAQQRALLDCICRQLEKELTSSDFSPANPGGRSRVSRGPIFWGPSSVRGLYPSVRSRGIPRPWTESVHRREISRLLWAGGNLAFGSIPKPRCDLFVNCFVCSTRCPWCFL